MKRERNALEKLYGCSPTLAQVAGWYTSWLKKLKYYKRMNLQDDVKEQTKKIDDLLAAAVEVYGKI